MQFQRTCWANLFLFMPRLFWLLLPVLLRGITVILTAGVSQWLSSAWMDLLFFAIVGLIVWLRWFHLQYRRTPDGIALRSGVLRRRLLLIPFENICTVTSFSPFWLRPLQITRLSLDTPAGLVKYPDMRLYVTQREAENIFGIQQMQSDQVYAARTYRPANSSILLLSLLTSNSLAGLLLAATFISNLGSIIGSELSYRFISTLDNLGRLLAFGIPPAAAAVAWLLLLAWSLAFGAELLRNKNFEARRVHGALSVKRGLLDIRSYIVQIKNINFVDIRSTLFSRILGLGAVYLHSTGINASGKDEIPVVPVVKIADITRILDNLLPEAALEKNQLRPNAGAILRFLGDALVVLLAVLAAGMFCWLFYPTWRRFVLFLTAMALIPVFWFLAVRFLDFQTSGVGKKDKYYTLRYSKGFYLHTAILPKERIVAVRTQQSVFQWFDGKCDVFVYSVSQGRTEHRLRNLDMAAAMQLFESDYPVGKPGKEFLMEQLKAMLQKTVFKYK